MTIESTQSAMITVQIKEEEQHQDVQASVVVENGICGQDLGFQSWDMFSREERNGKNREVLSGS